MDSYMKLYAASFGTNIFWLIKMNVVSMKDYFKMALIVFRHCHNISPWITNLQILLKILPIKTPLDTLEHTVGDS
jgi:hypothetical protein